MRRFIWSSVVVFLVPLPMRAQPTVAPRGNETQQTTQPRVTLVVRDSSLSYVLQTLTSQAGLGLAFDTNDPRFQRRITFQVHKEDVATAVMKALQGTGLTATFATDGETVVIRPGVIPGDRKSNSQDSGVVAVRVTDSTSGEGLSGATIMIVGTRLSGTTNARGEVRLLGVPVGERTVTIKLFGYRAVNRTIRVSKETPANVRVTLTSISTTLSGVVTTATGTQQKLEVGNSLVSLNVDSIMKTAPITSVTDLLESRVPGMTVQRSSGSPGDPARIRLRGTSSLYANNDPIIVVDGIRVYSQASDERNENRPLSNQGGLQVYAKPSPLDQIDPNSIQTIEVLKGPSASALYGSDAANGVIVITTKRGQSGPPQWNLVLNHGLSYLPGRWPENHYQWATSLEGGYPFRCLGDCGDAQVDSVMTFQALNHKRLTVLGTGSNHDIAATVSGGTSRGTSNSMMYSFTVSGGRTSGLLKLPEIEEERYLRFQKKPAPSWMRRPDRLDRRGVTGRMQIELSRTIGFAFMTSISQQVQRKSSMSISNETAIRELEGKYIDLSQLEQQPLLGNPYERVTSDNIILRNAVTLNLTPFSWLPINSTLGFSTNSSDNEMRIERGVLTNNDSAGAWSGTAQRSADLTGTAFTVIPVFQRLSLALGLNYTQGTINDLQGGFRGFAEGVADPGSGLDASGTVFNRTTRESRSFGWFIEPRMNVRSRFFVMPGFRLDNNGLAGKNAKFMGLPKMNFSWIASEEPFFPLKHIVNMLRIRSAFGVAGVQPRLEDGTRLYNRFVVNRYDGPSEEYGEMLTLRYLGNSRLRPERGVEMEGGFDAELWNSRLTVTATHARNRRMDAIISAPYATSADGGGSLKMNLGDIEKTSTEVTFTAQLFERRSAALNVDVTLTRSNSKVLKLDARNGVLAAGGGVLLNEGQRQGQRYVVGYPMEGIWAYPIIGIVDLNGDGWITYNEVRVNASPVYVGRQEPAFAMTVNPGMSILNGRLTVHALLSYQQGQLQSLGNVGASSGQTMLLNRLLGEDSGRGKLFAQGALAAASVRIVNDQLEPVSAMGLLQNVDVLRLQSLSVSMALGGSVTRLIRARSASVSIQGANLGLWSNYVGVDPNVNAFPTGAGITDNGQLPQPRIWSVRVAVGY